MNKRKSDLSLRLLIITTKTKIFHLQQFANELENLQINSKVLIDEEFITNSYKLIEKSKKIKNFKNMVLDFNPDLVIIDRLSELGKEIIKMKIPLGIILRGDYWEEYKIARETLTKFSLKKIRMSNRKKIYDECIKNAKIIFPISKYLESVIHQHFPNKKTHVLYNSRNKDDWYKTKGMKLKHPSVGLLQGAGIWKKTKEILILKKVVKKLPHVSFYWAGDGPYKEKILDEMKYFDNFIWLGNLRYPDQVREFLSEIDIYALVSGMDSLGQTILEASLMEKPILASNVGGIPEIIKENETGMLVGLGDYKKWETKIIELLKNPEKANKLGKNAREHITKTFSWKSNADKFVKILKENELLKNK